jgi:Ca-activated chloride channel family protein
MSTGPVDNKVRAALEKLGRESITPSPSFSDQVLNEITSLAVERTKRMRRRNVVLWILLILASFASVWMLFDGGAAGGRMGTTAHIAGGGHSVPVANAVNAVMIGLEGSVGALAMLTAGIIAIFLLPLRRYKSSAAFCTIALGCFVLRSMTSTYFNDTGVGIGSIDQTQLIQKSNSHLNQSTASRSKSLVDVHPMMDYEPTTAQIFRKVAEGSDGASNNSTTKGTGGERYGEAVENRRGSVTSEPLSTFSSDVDTGSYTNMRRFVRQGQLPPPQSVRIEEYLNYFSFPCNTESDGEFNSCYEIAPSPYEGGRHLLKLTIKAKEAPLPDNVGWNIVFLVDVSGSMDEPTKLPLVKESLKLLAQRMRPIDRVAVVTYAGAAGVALPSTLGSQRSVILSAIDALGAGGSTAGSAGIETAYQIASEHFIAGSVNRVVLATDGDFNVGVTSNEELVRLIEEKRAKGITLTTLGFGQGNIREDIMEQLADKGNGNYFYIDSFQQARRVLEDQFTANMQVVAKDVKLQVEFNPAHVATYRLIGFDNRRLNAEDFTDDRKDAGEVGSGHTVTALYEVTLADSPRASDPVNTRRYSSTQPTPVAVSSEHSGELGILRLRYQSPEGGRSKLVEVPMLRSSILSSVDKASDDYRFAVAVAGLGELLRAGSYSSAIQLDTVLGIARGAIGSDPDGARHEFVTLASDVERLRR